MGRFSTTGVAGSCVAGACVDTRTFVGIATVADFLVLMTRFFVGSEDI